MWEPHICIVIDFLLLIESYDFLFQEMRYFFERYNVQDLFMKNLEHFILRHRVKKMSKEFVRDIVEYFTVFF